MAGRRRWTAERTSRVVVLTESEVALITPAIDAPVSRSTAASEQEERDRVGAERAEQRRGRVVEPLPRHAAARLDPLRVPRDRRAARAEAERARGEREREAGEEADRAGLERPHRGQDRAQHEDRPRGHQRGGHQVVDGADQDAQAVDGGVAGLPAVPAEVDDEGEEDRGGDEAEADDVEVALLEHRQARAPRRTRAAGAGLGPRLGLGRGLGLGTAAGGRHVGLDPLRRRTAGPCLLTRG